MYIYKKQIINNISKFKREKKDIKKIVIHYTANYKAGAEEHYKYFNSGNRKSSADVFIDEKNIFIINDWYKNYTWHVGDGKGKYGITNKNSIGIEMCMNGNFSTVIENTIYYVVKLLKEELIHLNLNDVVRHYDASRKLCPKDFVDLNIKGYNKLYTDFRNRIEYLLKDKKNYKDILEEISKYSKVWLQFIEDNKQVNLKGLIENIYYHKGEK